MHATSALTAKSKDAKTTGELSVEAQQMFASPPSHRPKHCPPSLWCFLVTKTIKPKDLLVRCPQAFKPIVTEHMDVKNMGTCDSLTHSRPRTLLAFTPTLASPECLP